MTLARTTAGINKTAQVCPGNAANPISDAGLRSRRSKYERGPLRCSSKCDEDDCIVHLIPAKSAYAGCFLPVPEAARIESMRGPAS